MLISRGEKAKKSKQINKIIENERELIYSIKPKNYVTVRINKHENKKCVNYYRHKILSKTMTLLYIITKTVPFNYTRSSRRQVPREIQP